MRLLAIISLNLVLFVAVAMAEPGMLVDTKEMYKAHVANLKWRFDPECASPIAAIGQCKGDYEVTTASKPRSDKVELAVVNGRRVLYSWTGHRWTTFGIRNDRLYYVDYGFNADGGTIIAIDLKTGKRFWSKALVSYDGARQPHSFAVNRVIIEINGDDAIFVWGMEYSGRYVEVKDAETGETVALKLFDTVDGRDRVRPTTGPVAP